jgi:hypothetical protein
MPQTRSNAKTGADAQPTSRSHDKENITPHSPQTEQIPEHPAETKTAGMKRKSSPNKETESKKRKSTGASKSSATNNRDGERSQKPRLSTPDLEFDYDRS